MKNFFRHLYLGTYQEIPKLNIQKELQDVILVSVT
jgi:hypothetical protein